MDRNDFDVLFIDNLQVIHLRREHKDQFVHVAAETNAQIKDTHIQKMEKLFLPLTKPLLK